MKKFIKIDNRMPTLDIVKFNLLLLARRIFFKNANVQFSQTGEELIILHLLKGINKGFYIDVGCNHPYKISNTFELYLKGWKGICIDANSSLVNLFQKKRRKDLALFAAVSDKVEEVTFTEYKYNELNTIDSKVSEKLSLSYDVKNQIILETLTLTDILNKHLPANYCIDLLSVDVEGNDYKVLTSLDFNLYRPKLIVVEIHGYNLSTITKSDIYRFLTSIEYELVNFATMNGYFMDKIYLNEMKRK
jgi:FkbM family methyltransferase